MLLFVTQQTQRFDEIIWGVVGEILAVIRDREYHSFQLPTTTIRNQLLINLKGGRLWAVVDESSQKELPLLSQSLVPTLLPIFPIRDEFSNSYASYPPQHLHFLLSLRTDTRPEHPPKYWVWLEMRWLNSEVCWPPAILFEILSSSALEEWMSLEVETLGLNFAFPLRF